MCCFIPSSHNHEELLSTVSRWGNGRFKQLPSYTAVCLTQKLIFPLYCTLCLGKKSFRAQRYESAVLTGHDIGKVILSSQFFLPSTLLPHSSDHVHSWTSSSTQAVLGSLCEPDFLGQYVKLPSRMLISSFIYCITFVIFFSPFKLLIA